MAIPALPALALPAVEEEAFSFELPEGFVAPDNVEDGASFETVAKVRIKDGRVTLESLNGAMLAPPEEEEPEDEEIVEQTEENEEEAFGPDGEELTNAIRASGGMI